MDNCLFKGPFNEKIVYGVPALNIVIVIITVTLATKRFGLTKVGAFLFTFVIAYGLYKVLCINTLFSEFLLGTNDDRV